LPRLGLRTSGSKRH